MSKPKRIRVWVLCWDGEPMLCGQVAACQTRREARYVREEYGFEGSQHITIKRGWLEVENA